MNKASAPIDVKFGGCGMSLDAAAMATRPHTSRIRPCGKLMISVLSSEPVTEQCAQLPPLRIESVREGVILVEYIVQAKR